MYRNGSFVWLDLMTSDLEKAQSFYGSVFGWEVASFALPDGEYPMIKVGEQTLGGYMEAPKGAPPHWVAHLSVDDVDARVDAVKRAGGEALGAPYDIPTVGRGAAVTDAAGAHLRLFRASDGDPTPATGHGSLHWMELWTQDIEKSKHFYQDAFGYTLGEMQMGPDMTYFLLKPGPADPIAGMMQSPLEDAPTMWLPYVEVDDVDKCAKAVKAGGGEVLGPINEQPGVGRFGMFKDPTGAVIGFIKPDRA